MSDYISVMSPIRSSLERAGAVGIVEVQVETGLLDPNTFEYTKVIRYKGLLPKDRASELDGNISIWQPNRK